MAFAEIKSTQIQGNPCQMFGRDLALVTAGDEGGYNTMTIAWGTLGFLWGKDVAIVFVRPQRYTYEFTEKFDDFTISFFGGGMKDALALCGRVSGRDVDKAKEAGLTPVFDGGAVYFEEATLVIRCKKAYRDVLQGDKFITEFGRKCYPLDDFHTVYIGEITKVLQKI